MRRCLLVDGEAMEAGVEGLAAEADAALLCLAGVVGAGDAAAVGGVEGEAVSPVEAPSLVGVLAATVEAPVVEDEVPWESVEDSLPLRRFLDSSSWAALMRSSVRALTPKKQSSQKRAVESFFPSDVSQVAALSPHKKHGASRLSSVTCWRQTAPSACAYSLLGYTPIDQYIVDVPMAFFHGMQVNAGARRPSLGFRGVSSDLHTSWLHPETVHLWEKMETGCGGKTRNERVDYWMCLDGVVAHNR